MNGVPLRGDENTMTVIWLMIEIIGPTGKVTHRNSFITDLPVERDNVAEMAACAGARQSEPLGRPDHTEPGVEGPSVRKCTLEYCTQYQRSC